jgi:hypothetical protein
VTIAIGVVPDALLFLAAVPLFPDVADAPGVAEIAEAYRFLNLPVFVACQLLSNVKAPTADGSTAGSRAYRERPHHRPIDERNEFLPPHVAFQNRAQHFYGTW